MTKRRVACGLGILAAVLLAGYLYASPYWTVHKVRDAASRGDAETVSAHVDFPALRESLKGSFGAAMMKHLAKDDQMRGNPFAAFGAGLAMMMAEKMVDFMVTPEGVRQMLEGQRPPTPQSDGATAPRGAPSRQDAGPVMRYEGFDRFTVTFRNAEKPTDEFTTVWHRSGLTWKLTAVRMTLPE